MYLALSIPQRWISHCKPSPHTPWPKLVFALARGDRNSVQHPPNIQQSKPKDNTCGGSSSLLKKVSRSSHTEWYILFFFPTWCHEAELKRPGWSDIGPNGFLFKRPGWSSKDLADRLQLLQHSRRVEGRLGTRNEPACPGRPWHKRILKHVSCKMLQTCSVRSKSILGGTGIGQINPGYPAGKTAAQVPPRTFATPGPGTS